MAQATLSHQAGTLNIDLPDFRTSYQRDVREIFSVNLETIFAEAQLAVMSWWTDTISDDVCVDVTGTQEAIDAWLAKKPLSMAQPESKPALGPSKNPFEYNEAPTDEMLTQMELVRFAAHTLWETIMDTPASPERSLALRKVQEAAMWANHSITHPEPPRV